MTETGLREGRLRNSFSTGEQCPNSPRLDLSADDLAVGYSNNRIR